MSNKSNTITFVLREKEDAFLNSEYLKEKGILVEPLPIVSLVCYEPNAFEVKFDYFVLTSPKAINPLTNFLKNNQHNLSNTIKFFTVGLETKEKLEKTLYKNIFQADGNSQSLMQLIINNTLPHEQGLWVAAKDRSFNLQEALRINNRKLEIYEAYKMFPIEVIDKDTIDSLIHAVYCNLVILSSRNLLITKNLLKKYDLFKKINSKSIVFVNSDNVAKKAKTLGWNRIEVIKKNFTKDILNHIVEITK